MAPRSSSACGGVRIKLLGWLAAGLFFGFGVCDLFMRLTAAPVPPLRLTAATTTITTTTGLANGQPAPTAATAAAAAAAAALPRRQIAPTLRHPPPPSAARGVAVHSSSLPRPTLHQPPHQRWAPSLWTPSPCPANCSSHGVCNLDVGECACELGFAGDDCSQRDEFPCNIPEGDELVSRCAGRCDDTELKCYCGGGKYPRRAMFQCEFKGVGRSKPWKASLAPSPNPDPTPAPTPTPTPTPTLDSTPDPNLEGRGVEPRARRRLPTRLLEQGGGCTGLPRRTLGVVRGRGQPPPWCGAVV